MALKKFRGAFSSIEEEKKVLDTIPLSNDTIVITKEELNMVIKSKQDLAISRENVTKQKKEKTIIEKRGTLSVDKSLLERLNIIMAHLTIKGNKISQHDFVRDALEKAIIKTEKEIGIK